MSPKGVSMTHLDLIANPRSWYLPSNTGGGDYVCVCVCVFMYMYMYMYMYVAKGGQHAAASSLIANPRSCYLPSNTGGGEYAYVCVCLFMYMYMYMYIYVAKGGQHAAASSLIANPRSCYLPSNTGGGAMYACVRESVYLCIICICVYVSPKGSSSHIMMSSLVARLGLTRFLLYTEQTGSILLGRTCRISYMRTQRLSHRAVSLTQTPKHKRNHGAI